MYSAPPGSTVLIDRNCHKSLCHLLMMSDIVPIYLRPLRNAYGILGGIPQREFTRASIAAQVQETPNATWPVHAVITNSTYDGLLYNTDYIKQTLEVPSIPVRVKVVVASVNLCGQRFPLWIQPDFVLPAPVSCCS